MGVINRGNGTSDPIVTRLVAEDRIPWYKKHFGSGLKDAKGKWAINASLLGFISSSYQLGSILAVPSAPWLNQRFGRRWSVFVGSAIMVVGALLQGFAQNVAMYVIARMLLGAGILFAIISGSSLIGELAHPKERAILTSCFNASYFIGSILAASIAIGTVNIKGNYSWRVPSLLQIIPSLLQIATVFLLPESPRWLVSQDRGSEAFAILVKYHAEGDTSSVLVNAEYAQIRSTIRQELEAAKQSWTDMLKPGMRRRVFIAAFLGLFTQMSGNTLLSYYTNLLFTMMGYTSSYAKTRINIANQVWSLLTATIIALYVTRFRRRWAFMASSTSMLLVFIGMTVAFHSLSVAKAEGGKNQAASIAALVFYFAYAPCYAIGNNSLTYTYLIELFPYAVRSRGIGIEQVFGKAGGFFSNFVNPIALEAIGWKFFAAYCAWIFFEFVFQLTFYPETRGRTLEELAFLFEDKAFADQAVHAVEKQLDDPSKGGVGVERIEEVTVASKQG
ncbi:hypothetical protein LTR62_004309 [Meristemomyces frigidus]|uniref:Major facilitator superfamily (MFS) profile domain-containing protein n=1 Tax=Meristemomyces frigidus TaxID=1508187 RepID=A0AAN7TQY8_9PEZI|nr:hypothetical protein LTR62_004309 [Meristemomyces frigidus]